MCYRDMSAYGGVALSCPTPPDEPSHLPQAVKNDGAYVPHLRRWPSGRWRCIWYFDKILSKGSKLVDLSERICHLDSCSMFGLHLRTGPQEHVRWLVSRFEFIIHLEQNVAAAFILEAQLPVNRMSHDTAFRRALQISSLLGLFQPRLN
jgi:hypothetical protein